MIAAWLGVAGALASLALLAASLAALKRRGSPTAPPSDPAFRPFVSIVKPLCGVDPALEDNLESFYRQDYRDFELIFAFADGSDPALAIARRVADLHPEVRSTFVVDAREPGRNAKVNRLESGVRCARGAVFLFSDGDVRVRRDFLRRTIAPLADPDVGLVSSLFRATGAASVAARLEALYLNGVLRAGTAAMAGILRMPCVVGKSIAVSREAWNAIGGLAPLRDHLAEDYLLGRRVAAAGYRALLAPDEIATISGVKSAASVWARHRRWAILRRRLGGAGYAAEALGSPALFVAAAVAFAPHGSAAPAVALGLWAARLGLEAIALRDGGSQERSDVLSLLLLPFRDVAVAVLFFAGLLGRRTRWRGRALRVGAQTLLLEDRRRTPRTPALPLPRGSATW